MLAKTGLLTNIIAKTIGWAGVEEQRGLLTGLCCSDQGSVALVVLPVHVNIRALGQSHDHVHVPMVARHYQAGLKAAAEEDLYWSHSGDIECERTAVCQVTQLM